MNDRSLNIITFDVLNIKKEDNIASHFSITKTLREIYEMLKDTTINIIVTTQLYTSID